MLLIPCDPNPLSFLQATITKAHLLFQGSADEPYRICISCRFGSSSSSSGSNKTNKKAGPSETGFTCTCPSFASNRSLSCKHIVYVLYRRFNVPEHDIWRHRKVTELSEFVRTLYTEFVEKKSTTNIA